MNPATPKQIMKPTRDLGPESEPFLRMWREVWAHRELVFFLAWRDVKVRYKQTVFGVLWAILRPAISAAVFTFVFGSMAKLPSGETPYLLVAMSGVLGWSLMSDGISGASQSMISNTSLVTKVYFPRIILPLAALCRGLVDWLFAAALYLGISMWAGHPPGADVILLPLAMIYALAVALGISLWFSAAGVRYRDVAHALPFALQVLFWISPIGYSSVHIPESVAPWYWCNPVVGVMELFRLALLGHANIPGHLLAVSITSGLCVLVGGLWFFRRMEAAFADVI